MAALITDEFRLINADNFIDSVTDPLNAYYIFIGLPNPVGEGYGRSLTWNQDPPAPTDNFSYIRHCYDTMMYGRRITPANIRRVIRRLDWSRGTTYEQYRDDYSVTNISPITSSTRLYDSNYYIITSDFRVYICLSNGSNVDNPTGNASEDEPSFVDTEPAPAGTSGDGYIWKYLFTVAPSDVIKFDSTEYITVPSDWLTSDNPQIESIRESGNSDINRNQIKEIYIANRGAGYINGSAQSFEIIGDGEGAFASVDVNAGEITRATVTSGGKGYTWGLVDLGSINSLNSENAKLDVIIPPSKGHGFDVYNELGTDRILIYARFDDSTQDFPIDTKFAQIGLIKNPTVKDSNNLFTENSFTASNALKFASIIGTPIIGEEFKQLNNDGSIAKAYVVAFDPETLVLKYIQDRSLYYNPSTYDNTDYRSIGIVGRKLPFLFGGGVITGDESNFTATIDQTFNDSSVTIGSRSIDLGVNFVNGLAESQINKPSGEILYLDNRPAVERNPRQKEDVKIILEF
jgi:hypothetical protein